MPIYAYKCAACGFAKDVLQKMSDAPLRQCPQCGAEAFQKQVTAAGFQLKGSGWYVTDFRDGGSQKGKQDKGSSQGEKPSAPSSGTSSSAPAPSAAPSPASAPAASTAGTPAPSSSGG
ncbi:zinc ribbon domain-containing protein [Comamonadaceae bacterium OH2545_COT-014]|nr:zinc ribbon domain-containing protein [Comamonadaceae bacterium OH2545_COT-014]